MTANHSLKKIKFKKQSLIMFVTTFSLLGIATLIKTYAASSPNTKVAEAESSSAATNTSTVADATASGNSYITFASTTPTPTPTPPPTPPVSTGTGIWISKDQIMQLPMSGTAWNAVKSAATGNLGSVNLGDNNSLHDTKVLALTYYAVRTNDTILTNKVVTELDTVRNSARERALPFCRNITDYVISADIIGLANLNPTVDKNFRDYIRYWVIEDTTLQGHSGDGVKGTAAKSANNWGTMCRAAYAATAIYLGDTTAINNVTMWHKGYLGDKATYNGFVYSSTNWHANSSDKTSINRKGATIQGQNVDGVLPEDQRRTGEFQWPAPQGHYPWEALQGAVVADVILQRRGLVSNTFQDSAMVRAYNWLTYTNSNPAASDDTWQPWLVNKIYGTNYPTSSPSNEGKIMAWTDWTHQ